MSIAFQDCAPAFALEYQRPIEWVVASAQCRLKRECFSIHRRFEMFVSVRVWSGFRNTILPESVFPSSTIVTVMLTPACQVPKNVFACDTAERHKMKTSGITEAIFSLGHLDACLADMEQPNCSTVGENRRYRRSSVPAGPSPNCLWPGISRQPAQDVSCSPATRAISERFWSVMNLTDAAQVHGLVTHTFENRECGQSTSGTKVLDLVGSNPSHS